MGGRNVTDWKKRFVSAAVTAALWFFAGLVLVIKGPHHAWMGIKLTAVVLLVLFARLFGKLSFSFFSCLTLFPALVLEMLLFYEPIAHAPFLVILFLADCCTLIYWQKGNLKEEYAGLSLTAFAGVFLLGGYEFLSEKMLPVYFDFSAGLNLSTFGRMLLILGFGLFYMLVFWLAFLTLGRWLRIREKTFQAFWVRFSGLEHYVFLLVVFTIFLMLLIESGCFMGGMFSYMSWRMLWFQVFFLFMDVVYLGLLAKAVSIKENAAKAQKDKELALDYNAVLEQNMESLKAVRHDTKNLLLSMGGFVERSNDEQMKSFYRENIVPFMEEALEKGGIQDKLRFVEDIPLKTFLYYKITEKLEAEIPVSLELCGPVSAGGDFGDLVRLLGIFIDNAAEETALAGGTVRIAVREEKGRVRFRIGNAVRQAVRERGITAGRSEKGTGRGNGLLIAERILSGNKNMVWNSYFTEDEFVQALTVEKRE